MEQYIGLFLALLLMAGGLVGSVVPGIPGPPLVMAAAILHRLYFGVTGPSTLVLGVLAVMMVLSLALDYLASSVGARKLGATWRGVLGAALGALLGFFAGPLGIILGPFIGATLLELAGGRELKEASKAGLGAFLGLVAGVVGKVACCVAMIGLFVVNVAFRSFG